MGDDNVMSINKVALWRRARWRVNARQVPKARKSRTAFSSVSAA